MLALSSLTRSHVETRQQIHFSFLQSAKVPRKDVLSPCTNNREMTPATYLVWRCQRRYRDRSQSWLGLGGRTRTHPVCTTDHCGFSPLATFPRQLVQSDALKDPTCTSGSHLYSETLASCGGVAPLLLESTKIKNKGSLKPLRINQHL